jgi:hypothetical protein
MSADLICFAAGAQNLPKFKFQNLCTKYDNKGSHTTSERNQFEQSLTHHDISFAVPSPVTLYESMYVQVDWTVLDEVSVPAAGKYFP